MLGVGFGIDLDDNFQLLMCILAAWADSNSSGLSTTELWFKSNRDCIFFRLKTFVLQKNLQKKFLKSYVTTGLRYTYAVSVSCMEWWIAVHNKITRFVASCAPTLFNWCEKNLAILIGKDQSFNVIIENWKPPQINY